MEWSNERNLITSFFTNLEDYNRFCQKLRGLVIANNEGTVFAELEKKEGYFLYTLTWLEDQKYIGDYIKVFEPTEENIKVFNDGCRILAERLEIYITTNDEAKVPMYPPAFGELTHVLK